ncbi:MAG: phage tail tape measure protein [Collinsella sp.]
MDLAASGSLQLADAANVTVQAMGAFGLSAGQTGEAANALAGAAAASSADVSDLTQGLSQVSAQAHSAGWSIQDTTAVPGAFADAGIAGSDAGTSLKPSLQRSPRRRTRPPPVMESLGIKRRDSNGNMMDAAA